MLMTERLRSPSKRRNSPDSRMRRISLASISPSAADRTWRRSATKTPRGHMEFGLLDGYAMRIVKTTSGRRLCIRTSVTHVSVVHGGACGTVVEGEIPAFAGMTWGAG